MEIQLPCCRTASAAGATRTGCAVSESGAASICGSVCLRPVCAFRLIFGPRPLQAPPPLSCTTTLESYHHSRDATWRHTGSRRRISVGPKLTLPVVHVAPVVIPLPPATRGGIATVGGGGDALVRRPEPFPAITPAGEFEPQEYGTTHTRCTNAAYLVFSILNKKQT